MAIDDTWYTEEWADQGSAISLKIKTKLCDRQSPYQRIEIFETESFGRLMTLDGLVMVTERDNFIYHEMLTHPALCSHKQPEKVLVIGGGDCGTLKEVLKHEAVKHVDMVELDADVTHVAEEFFPELCSSNHDPRAAIHFEDGIKWVKDANEQHYDVILVDSTDPVGPAAGLFEIEFYRQCFRVLTGNGILALQSESPLFHPSLIQAVDDALGQAGFTKRKLFHFPQCTYPSGWWSATVAAKNATLSVDLLRRPTLDTRYYSHELYAAAAIPPRFLQP